LPIAVLALCLAGCGRSGRGGGPAPAATGYWLTVDGRRVDVTVAVTFEQQQRGLMHRTQLDENAGMLFVYDREQTLRFWMKDTPLPLSIAFIDGDLVVRDIQDMRPLDETTHESAAPAMFALEVNQGWFRRHKVGVGARVAFSPELEELLGM